MNTAEFKNFKLYSNSTFKKMNKDELIDYIHILRNNWGCTDESYLNVVNRAKDLQNKLDNIQQKVTDQIIIKNDEILKLRDEIVKLKGEKSKSAKEMFEDLGFIHSKVFMDILYTYKNGLRIKFGIFDKGYTFGLTKDTIEKNEEEFSLVVGNKVHMAINQQLKELGVVR